MPANEAAAKSVLCPFFRGASAPKADTIEWQCRIGCEGNSDDSAITFRFRALKDYTAYKQAFCDADYSRCPVYAGLMATKYREDL